MDKKRLLLWTAVAFVALAVLYFLPVSIPFKLVFPMALLFVAGCVLQSWPIIAAAFFSALGDGFGVAHQFLPQMGSFAVAHLCFIGYFLSLAWKRKKAGEKAVGGLWFAIVTLFAVGIFFLASEKIIPFAPAGVVRTGMIVYAVLIVVMMWSALMLQDWMWGIGAVLFVFSDCVLAVVLFVRSIPDGQYWIMVPYFAAQLLIFVRAALERAGMSEKTVPSRKKA